MWQAVVDTITRKQRAHTLEAFSTRDEAAVMAVRFDGHRVEHRAGHLFELWHKHSFNTDAITKNATARARVTASGGEPTAAADLRILDGGRVVGEVQAKLYGRASAAARALAHPRYTGMQRLVAEDKREQVENLLDKALRRDADGIYQDDYSDTRAHLADVVSHSAVTSTPVATGDVHRAAENIARWGDGLALRAAGREIASAAAAGAAVNGGLAGATAAVREVARVRSGETTAVGAASSAAGAAARAAARAGLLSGLGAGAKVAMTALKAPAPVVANGLPGAVSAAVFGVADAAVALARGDIDRGEFAATSGEVTFRAGMAWAGGAVGQAVFPVPVLGALVGGFVGQVSATVVAQGIQIAMEVLRSQGQSDSTLSLLEAEADAAVEMALLLGEAERALGAENSARIGVAVVPQLEHALRLGIAAGPQTGVAELLGVAGRTDGESLFERIDDFGSWMADSTTSLSLSTVWSRPTTAGPPPPDPHSGR